MRVLITGGGGFAGRHLAAELAALGHEISLFDCVPPSPPVPCATPFAGDLRSEADLARVVAAVPFDACVHLAAITYVPDGERDPGTIQAVNVGGTLNLMRAIHAHRPAARVLFVSSALIYAPADGPLAEEAPLAPVTRYAASKAEAERQARAFAEEHGVALTIARPNNHTGPGQPTQFVVPSLARQVKALAAGPGAAPVQVGNLASERVFMDVRDVVRAYRLLLDRGRPGAAYNICNRQRVSIGELLVRLGRLARVEPRSVVDPARFRPTDRAPILDTTRIEADTGWQPRIPLDRTLSDVLDTV